MTILFPAQPYSSLREVDSEYLSEYNNANFLNFNIVLFDFDEFVKRGNLLLSKQTENPKAVIYRGWMMKSDIYACFYKACFRNKLELINNPLEYQYKHEYPYVYNTFPQSCSLSVNFVENSLENIKKATNIVGTDFILKDYVKSAKGVSNLFRIKDKTNEEISQILEEFKEYRDNHFNTGFVFKHFEELQQEEFRVFIFKKQVLSINLNSDCKEGLYTYKHLMISNWIANNLKSFASSDFFTIDFGFRKSDDSLVLLECGDGQVSGLASHQNALSFYTKLKRIINE